MQGGCQNIGQDLSITSRYSMLELAERMRSVAGGMLNDLDKEFIDLQYANLEALITENPDAEAIRIREKYNSLNYDQAFMRTQWFVQQAASGIARELNHQNMTYISPNGDNIADQIVVGFRSPYAVSVRGMTLLDADGNRIAAPQYSKYIGKTDAFTSVSCSKTLSGLKEGQYTAEVTVTRDSDGQTGAVSQKVSVPFTIDRTPPKVRSEVTMQNGRKILKLTASAPILDGFVISGKGSGGVAGSYNPADKPK